MIGSNGRPIVLSSIRYKVDVAALARYASTDEAARLASDDDTELRAGITERELIERFLQHITRGDDGEGTCTVSYTRCRIGQALVDVGFSGVSWLLWLGGEGSSCSRCGRVK